MQQMRSQYDIQQTFLGTPKFGLTDTKQDKNFNECDLDDNVDDEDDITQEQLTELLNKAKELHNVIATIKKQRVTKSIFNERYVPFMNSASSLFSMDS